MSNRVDNVEVYDGIWGYNSLLSMAAVSCVFYPLTVSSFLAGLVNVVTTVFIQKALAVNMSTVRFLFLDIFGLKLHRAGNVY